MEDNKKQNIQDFKIKKLNMISNQKLQNINLQMLELEIQELDLVLNKLIMIST